MRGSFAIPALSSPGERKRNIGIDLVVLRTTGALGSANLEAVLEAAVDVPQVSGTAGTSGLASLGLLAPVVCCPRIIVSQSSRNHIPPFVDSIAIQQEKKGIFVHLRVLAAG